MTLADPMLDDCHHALGRPEGPHVVPYRNRYVIGRDSKQAAAMRASPFWLETGTMNQGRDSIFAVSDEGKAAMWNALKAQNDALGLRAFRVGGGRWGADVWECRVIMAKSPAAARYTRYLGHASEYMTFREFLATGIQARRA